MDCDNRLDYVSCSLNACPALSRQAGVVDAFSNYCLVSHYAFDHFLPSCNHSVVVIACDAYHSFVAAAVAGMNYSKDLDVVVVFDAHLLIY